MHIISIALVQTDLIWKDKKNNLINIEQRISKMHENVDIIVLPELFNTAFCIDDLSLAENENSETVAWMKQISNQKKCAICGSILIKENGKVYNRFLFIENNEIKYRYNKHQLFSLVNEDKYLEKGNEKILIDFKGWKIQPFICYDLRFPTWCQNTENTDVQIYIASWPKKRIHHWTTLLQARAIENQCYTIGVNRIGFDFYNNEHNGNSVVYDFKGDLILNMNDKNGIDVVTLSIKNLNEHKTRYPFWKDR